jgi:Ca2+-binding EF-hand superfamily protein
MLIKYKVEAPPDVKHLIRKINRALLKKTNGSILGCREAFNQFAEHHGSELPFSLFSSLMAHIFSHSRPLNNFEQNLLFQHFDHDQSGSIDAVEFQRAVCGRMPKDCLDFVRQKFDQLDKNGDGSLSKDELTFFFSAPDHPSVKQGMKTRDDALQEMLVGFHCETDKDRVSFADWSGFHLEMYCVTSSPESFKKQIETIWQSREALLPALIQRIKHSLSRQSGGSLGASRAFHAVAEKEADSCLDFHAFCGLLDKLTGGTNGSTNVPQFDQQERIVLFEHFDQDASGDVDVREFQQAVCGKRRMPKEYANAVIGKFRELDADSSWSLSKAELLAHYTPDSHRDVKAGVKSRKRVKAELLEALQLEGRHSGEGRGEISFEDWAAYHNENLASYDQESYNGTTQNLTGTEAAIKQLEALWPSTKVLAQRKDAGCKRASRASRLHRG